MGSLHQSRLLVAALALLLAMPAALAAPPAPAEAAPAPQGDAEWVLRDRIIVGFHDAPRLATGALSAALAWTGARVLRVDETLSFAVVEVEPARQQEAIAAALSVKGVAYAKPDMLVRATFVPNDPRYPEQWGAPAIQMEAAWDVTRGDHSRMVAVLDTGVDGTHPDLAANFCVDGPDLVNGDASSMDDHGHGTHVAGTVAAAIHNGVGVAGMADACIMAVKVLDAGGSGTFSGVASGIVWAADNGADVISMSLGGCPGCDPGAPVTDAVAHAEAQGVLIVAAAGNAGCAPVSYPAAYAEVMAIAALSPPGDTRAGFSSCGEEVEVSAPGQDVLSTSLTSGPLSHPSGYMSLSGTSMATPHVSGVAALLWSHAPALTASEVRCILVQTADDVDAPGHDTGTGYGRIDAAAALAASGCVPSPPTAPSMSGRGRDQRAELRWSGAGSYGSAITSYQLYRGDAPSNLSLLATLDAAARSYVDQPLVNNVTYWYAVSATNGVGEGPLSAAISVTPVPPGTISCLESGDSFGNTCSSAPYAFIDVSATGTPLIQADDAVARVDLPFAFRFYGAERTSVEVSTNGFLAFASDGYSGCCSPRPLPEGSAPNGMVAGYWADLFPVGERDIVVETRGTPGSRIVIVQFTDVAFYAGDGTTVTFQFQLHEATGAIEVHYLEGVSDGRVVGAGMEDCAGSDGFNAFHDVPDFAQAALRFSPGDGAARPCVPNTPPSVSILEPEQNGVYQGVVAWSGVASDADDGDAVELVEAIVYNDTFGAFVPIDGTTTWSGSFNMTGFQGEYFTQARAYDGSTYTYSDIVSFFVDPAPPNRPPSVAITSPAHNATVRGLFDVTGFANDLDDGVAFVALSVDGGAEQIATGTTSWSITLDAEALGAGVHSLTAIAYDTFGAASLPASILVRVPAFDLGVRDDGIGVERQRITTEVGSAPNPVNERRTIVVRVTNEGATTSGEAWLDVEVVAHTRVRDADLVTRDHVGTVAIPALEPGAFVDLRLGWDTTTTVGDVEIVASIAAPLDGNAANDRAVAETFVRVGGTNVAATV